MDSDGPSRRDRSGRVPGCERKVKDRFGKERRRGRLGYVARGVEETQGQIPSDLMCQIVCGDALEILRRLPNECIDLVLTSPPYNFGLDYGSLTTNEDTQDWNLYFERLFTIFDQCIRVTKHGGRIVINIQPLFSDYIPSHHIISQYFYQRGLIWRGEILWEKNNYNCKYTAWGSWCSPSSPYLKYSWEFIEVFCKGSLRHRGNSTDSDLEPDEFKKWVYGKWSIAPERKMRHYGHPAMFPEELARRVIKLFSFRDDVVLDPFNGVGTTTLVAKKLNRQYLGSDISPVYCETARRRLDELLI